MRQSRGVSLVEVLVAIGLLGLVVTSLVAAFGGIQRSAQRGKASTLATSLCRELMENLRSQRYALLRPTTQADLDAFGYDATYFPAEQGLRSAGLSFDRFNRVSKIAIDGAGRALPLPPTGTDGGLKRVEVWVNWIEEGRSRTVSMSGLIDDPARSLPMGAVSGAAYRAPGGAGNELAGVDIILEQNSSRRDLTGADGAYRILTSSGVFTLRATKQAFFPARAAVTANPNATQDFTLVARGSGTIQGYAYLRDHPLISRVVISTIDAGFEAQFIELYNPTTAAIALSGHQLRLRYRSPSAPFDCADIDLALSSAVLPSRGFYMIGNAASFVVSGATVVADASFSDSGAASCLSPPPGWAPPALRRLLQPGQPGSLALIGASGIVDLVGWTAGGLTPSPCEGACAPLVSGLLAGQQLVRLSTPTAAPGIGSPSYDCDSNESDFALGALITPAPRTSASATVAAQTGTPAVGAVISADDDLSSPVWVSSATGWFELPSVATCTNTGAPAAWTIQASSRGLSGSVSAAAPPQGGALSAGVIALAQEASSGVVTGQVISGMSVPLPGIIVTCSGESGTTDSGGHYRLVVAAGSGLRVAANPGHADATLSTALSASFDLLAGLGVSGVDFTLDSVGSISGTVTTDGVNPLPGAVVESDAPAGTLRATGTTDASGHFLIEDLPVSSIVGDYTVFPVVNSGQASTPASVTATVTAGAEVNVATFTISRALGAIAGTVSENGQPISAGVLIMASEISLASTPPVWDEALRAGSSSYYSVAARPDGTFTLPVRLSATPYNVYAWYSKVSGGATTVTALKTASQVVSAPTTYTVSFTWP